MPGPGEGAGQGHSQAPHGPRTLCQLPPTFHEGHRLVDSVLAQSPGWGPYDLPPTPSLVPLPRRHVRGAPGTLSGQDAARKGRAGQTGPRGGFILPSGTEWFIWEGAPIQGLPRGLLGTSGVLASPRLSWHSSSQRRQVSCCVQGTAHLLRVCHLILTTLRETNAVTVALCRGFH